MFVQIKRIVVTEGHSDKIIERFGAKEDGPTLLEQQPGFIDKQVLVKKVRRGDEEVLIVIRWESEEAWKNWEKNPEHVAGHKANAGKPKPDYMIESGQEVYYVKG
ncbi:antibiotic biosynthesis monooxygenase family protein [Lysinibacillus xylanilyticus]|uniref:antibiotic biosynthesis monooxygenase family protein n=1 Tax=Lysinibacillus xylanilyticus TaxID=582475 RepID=UPI003D041E73